MLQKVLLVALAGALGTLTRYALAGFIRRANLGAFPWGTLAVNICGCFLAGMLWSLFEQRWPASSTARTVVLVGFMGAFTTFSAYILDTAHLARGADWLPMAANIIAQNALGFAALFAGIALARAL